MLVRTAANPLGLVPAVRRAVWAISQDQPVVKLHTMEQILSQSVIEGRLILWVTGLFAIMALILAGVGLYGVISHSVSRRMREIGIRLALGAQKSHVLRMILGQGLVLLLAGVSLGIITAMTFTRVLAGQLFGVAPSDPMTFIGITLLLVAVSLVACYVSARRAIQVDPNVLSRFE